MISCEDHRYIAFYLYINYWFYLLPLIALLSLPGKS